MGNDLVGRLNNGCILAQNGLGGVDMNATDALCQEAAARIEALEEALKPFADAYVNREEWALDSYIGGSNLRNRDLRRAARAHADKGEQT